MQRLEVDFEKTGLRSKMLIDYIKSDPFLDQFYKYKPSYDSFPQLIEDRESFNVNREVLSSELLLQHGSYFDAFPELKNNILSLQSEKTFTVTTGHQLCFAGGPMFFFYKIITTINLAKQLKKNHPDYSFVPVYWMASEDHDFEEISTLNVFNKTLKWNQSVKGVTGKIPTASLPPLLDEMIALFGEAPYAAEMKHIIEESYCRELSLADATRHFVLSLFGDEGLVVLDADRKALKELFLPILKDELLNQPSFRLVNKTNDILGENYKIQVLPRAVNLFYLDDQLRERIVQAPDEYYEIVNTELKFSKNIMLDLLEHQPERFSPNVVLRPVYQETILPNLAYIGGPGELAYWLELKAVFDHYGVFYPMLVPRNSAVILSLKQLQKFEALGFTLEDVFKGEAKLIATYTASLEVGNVHIDDEMKAISHAFFSIGNKLSAVDQTLSGPVSAEHHKLVNSIDHLQKKMMTAVKRKHEVSLSQIKSISQVITHERVPQERLRNFIPYYLKQGKQFIRSLKENLEPFAEKLTVLIEN